MDYCRWSLIVAVVAAAAVPAEVQWADYVYGEDHLWHVVAIYMGTDSTPVHVYPGSFGASNVLTTQYCSTTSPYALCDPNGKSSWDPSASNPPAGREWAADFGLTNWMYPLPTSDPPPVGTFVTDGMSVPLIRGTPLTSYVGVYAIDSGGYRLTNESNATTYQFDYGTLSLGGPSSGYILSPYNDTVAPYTPDSPSDIVANFTPNAFYLNGRIPSASWGLHYGSVTQGIPPSLVYGGYDISRVIGPVIRTPFGQSGETRLQLKDIVIGTAMGSPPMSFQNKSGSGILSSGALTVDINPAISYLVLPYDVCASIAQYLPVSYDPEVGMWRWAPNGPGDIVDILNGASFLGFVFTSLDGPDVTIKVPFRFLILSLKLSPQVPRPSYFTCLSAPDNSYALGRAFLQAAFFGGNWEPRLPQDPPTSGTWFLAQAPGPNYPTPSIVTIQPSDTDISAGNASWVDSWAIVWEPSPTDYPAGPSPSGYSNWPGSSNEKHHVDNIAIILPVIFGVAILLITVVGIKRRKRIPRNRNQTTVSIALDDAPPPYAPRKPEDEPIQNEVEVTDRGEQLPDYSHHDTAAR